MDTIKEWKCPKCGWVEKAHPAYGWQFHNDRAVEVHETILCSNMENSNGPNGK